MRKNIASPNCKHDCENSTDQSSRAPDYLIAKERLMPQIPETVLTPPDHGALSDHARANRMSRLKATAGVSADPFHTEVRRQVALYFQQEGTDSKGGARVWRKATLLLAWLAASWATFVFTTTGPAATMMMAASAGLAMAGIGFNIQHDGSHRSLSRRRWAAVPTYGTGNITSCITRVRMCQGWTRILTWAALVV